MKRHHFIKGFDSICYHPGKKTLQKSKNVHIMWQTPFVVKIAHQNALKTIHY